jgi:tripartite-type tricarboxylate transporter receptor subunit TctC
MQRRHFALGLGSVLCAPALSLAQQAGGAAARISGPVRIVVGFAPGGGTDVLARVIGQKLATLWDTQVLVENKPGATGVIAADHVARQPADGTTLLMAHVNSNAIAPSLLKDTVKFDPNRDFSAISMVGVTPNVLTCATTQTTRTLPDIVALCRQKPGRITFGSSGIGSAQHWRSRCSSSRRRSTPCTCPTRARAR